MTRPVPGAQIVGRGSLATLPSPPLPSQAFFPWRRCQLSERLEHDYTESIAGSIQGLI